MLFLSFFSLSIHLSIPSLLGVSPLSPSHPSLSLTLSPSRRVTPPLPRVPTMPARCLSRREGMLSS